MSMRMRRMGRMGLMVLMAALAGEALWAAEWSNVVVVSARDFTGAAETNRLVTLTPAGPQSGGDAPADQALPVAHPGPRVGVGEAPEELDGLGDGPGGDGEPAERADGYERDAEPDECAAGVLPDANPGDAADNGEFVRVDE